MATKKSNAQKPAVLFFHNAVVGYTRPFFKRLSEIYDTRFVFINMRLSQSIYGVREEKQLEGFDSVDYRILKHPFGMALGVTGEMLKGGYDLIVDTPGSKESIITFIMAKIMKKPVILWSEDWHWKGKDTEHRWSLPLMRFMVSHADAVFGPGSKHREYLVSLGASPDKAFIVPNSTELSIGEEDYKKTEDLKKKLKIEGKKVILYVGRLTERKGVAYLIEAFSRLVKERGDTVLIIAGRGDIQPGLEQLADALNARNDVIFTGYVEEKDLAPYYLLCDVCVTPSITHGMGDPWVFVVNEAMSAGKPVIATDAVGAAYDMIQDGVNGFMVPEKDSDALYQKMKIIVSDSQLAKKMGEASAGIIRERFTYRHMAESFSGIVDFVLKDKRLRKNR